MYQLNYGTRAIHRISLYIWHLLYPFPISRNKSRVTLTFTIPPEEVQPFVNRSVRDIATELPLKGFRPGKTGYEEIARAYGEGLILETALRYLLKNCCPIKT